MGRAEGHQVCLNLGRSGVLAAPGPRQLEVWDATWALWVLSGRAATTVPSPDCGSGHSPRLCWCSWGGKGFAGIMVLMNTGIFPCCLQTSSSCIWTQNAKMWLSPMAVWLLHQQPDKWWNQSLQRGFTPVAGVSKSCFVARTIYSQDIK